MRHTRRLGARKEKTATANAQASFVKSPRPPTRGPRCCRYAQPADVAPATRNLWPGLARLFEPVFQIVEAWDAFLI